MKTQNSITTNEAEAINDATKYIVVVVPHQMPVEVYSGDAEQLVHIAQANDRVRITFYPAAPTWEDEDGVQQPEEFFKGAGWYVATDADGNYSQASSLRAALAEGFGHDANNVKILTEEEAEEMVEDAKRQRQQHQGDEILSALRQELCLE